MQRGAKEGTPRTMSESNSAPPPESGGGERFDACMLALKQWRDASSEPAVRGLKDTQLQHALVRGGRDPQKIAAVLPAAYGGLAPQIVDVINDADPDSRVASPTAATSDAGTGTGRAEEGEPRRAAAGPIETSQDSASTNGQVDLHERAGQFAPLDFSEEIGDPAPLRVAVQTDTVKLAWDPPAEQPDGTFYRVVSKDDEPPYDPSYAELLDITSELTSTDDREFASGIRYFQVWRNSGATPTEAMSRQPRLHAEAAIVAPIQHLSLREDAGRVIGEWSVLPGITKVHVHRIPMDKAAKAGHDPQYRFETGDLNLSGFIDREVTRGQTYLYRFYAEASINGVARLSAPVGKTLAVSALLSPVDDLVAEGHGTEEDWQFDLAWSSPPAGRVVIYRTSGPPKAGVEDDVLGEAALATAGLQSEERLAHPTHRNPDGTMGMREVPSPHGWDRVYFTPVTLIDGKARVGRFVSQAVIPTPKDPVVVERTQHQILKFGWPSNAAAVAVSIGAIGAPAATPQDGSGYLEISRASYERLGGLQFPTPLPAHGCSVHVAGISFVNRQRFYGTPAVAHYPGLWRGPPSGVERRGSNGAQVPVPPLAAGPSV
jgi:hypothetical protein